MLLDDGTTQFTHGGDPAPSYESPYQYTPGQVKPACVRDPKTEFHGRVLYVRPQDAPDRFPSKLFEIRVMVNQVNGFLRAEAAQFGRVVNYRMLCSGTNVSVTRVVVPFNDRDRHAFYGEIVSEVRKQGFTDPMEKYWIWYDGSPRKGAAGVGSAYGDDTRSAQNASNYGAEYAITFGLGVPQEGWFVMMHEGGHNLGNVQDSAPNSSTAGHCNDGHDVMCYQEPFPHAPRYIANVCPTLHFDCNHNDYFNPKPAAGSYLATHWNLGSPLDRFVSGCTFATGTVHAGLQGQAVKDLSLAEASIPSSCWGHSFALSGEDIRVLQEDWKAADQGYSAAFLVYALTGGVSALPAILLYETVYEASSRVYWATIPDFNVCFFRGQTQLKCFTGAGTDTGTIPWGTTSARIVLFSGSDATYYLNAI